MLTNVPDAVEMKQAALWLFFNAWEKVLDVLAFKNRIEPSENYGDEVETYIDDFITGTAVSVRVTSTKPRVGIESENMCGQCLSIVLRGGCQVMGKE